MTTSAAMSDTCVAPEQRRKVATGGEAIDVALSKQPSCILMDINLRGEMNGIDAARKIIATLDTKIVFLTGYQDREFREKAMQLNPVAYLIKPISFDQLKKVIYGIGQ